MIILSSIYGIMGVLSAGPVADGLAFVLAVTLLVKETRNMKNDGVETEKAERKEIPETAVANNGIVITIAREYGSGEDISENW